MNNIRINGARVEIWRDLAELSERASELLIGIAREAAARGAFTLALSGGSTPKALYELLATEEKAARIPWEEAHIFWSDERCVPPTDSQSNYRMADEALLSRVNISDEHIHRMRGEDEPHVAAQAYAAELEKQFGAGDPRFSLILLGMGEDGHTASLFPHTPALKDASHTVVANYVEQLASHRLTMTLRTLNAAATVIFLVSGEAKAAALDKVFETQAIEDDAPPARLVRPAQGELIWLVDEAAAKLISSRY
ncbi:MAG TPA: 6-phosphogluconolactonase [Pyrinomonadaceae bacterium]|jgi:6-phosphogluconolactonase